MFPVGRIFYPPSSRFVPSEVIFVNQPPIFPKKTTPPAPPELRRRPAASPCQPLGLISPVNPRILTSGHVFRLKKKETDPNSWKGLNPFYIRSRIPTDETCGTVTQSPGLSQSLLHQVTYSDPLWQPGTETSRKCLNPFYIRSRIPTSWPGPPRRGPRCLNPFYIRSRIPTG